MLENYTIPLGLQIHKQIQLEEKQVGGSDEFKPKIDWDSMNADQIMSMLDNFNMDHRVDIPKANSNRLGLTINSDKTPLKYLINCECFSIVVPGQTIHSTLKPLPTLVFFGKDDTKESYDGFYKYKYPDCVVDDIVLLNNIDSLADKYNNITIATPYIYDSSDKNTLSHKNYISKNNISIVKKSNIDIFGKYKEAQQFYDNPQYFLELAIMDFFIRVLENRSITEWINHVLDTIEKNVTIENAEHLHTIVEDLRITIVSIFQYYSLEKVYNLDLINYSYFSLYYQQYVDKYSNNNTNAQHDIDMFTHAISNVVGNLEDIIRTDNKREYSIPYENFIENIHKCFDEFHESIENSNQLRITIDIKLLVEEADRDYIYKRLVCYIEVMEDIMYITKLLFSDTENDMVFIYTNTSQISRMCELLVNLMYHRYTTIYTYLDADNEYIQGSNVIMLKNIYINLEELHKQVRIKDKFYIKNMDVSYPEYEPGVTTGLKIGDMLLNKLSGPVSINILVPEPNDLDINLPVIMLFGDIHFDRLSGCDNCSVSNNCIAINEVEFLQGLDTMSKDVPTNIYIEQFYDPSDREMLNQALADDDKNAIHRTLEEQMKFNERGDYLTDLFHNNFGCFIKEIRKNPYFSEYCKSEYPQWHYLDVRNLMVSSYYKQHIYYETIYLGLIGYMENKQPIHKYIEYIVDLMANYYGVTIDNPFTEQNMVDTFSIMIDSIESFYSFDPKKIVDLVFNDKYMDYSIIQKQFYKNNKKTQAIWKNLFEKYIKFKLDRLKETNKNIKNIVSSKHIRSKFEYILDKYYYTFNANTGRFNLEQINNKDDTVLLNKHIIEYTIDIKSAIADIYFILRTFKVLPEDSVYPKFVIGYFGNAHTIGLTHFFTKIAKLYKIEYRIQSKEGKKSYKNYRCLEFKHKLVDIEKLVDKYTSSSYKSKTSEIPEELI